ncbi:hypothetical protein [Kordia sp.]|uniref:hypothetical protein n=1 Tax=Kordia sp. TaxID=1965332 RepID=UPI003B5BCEE6
MKKRSLNNLKLNKKTISNFDETDKIVGGNSAISIASSAVCCAIYTVSLVLCTRQ